MARKLRVEYEGGIYHVTIRGVGRRFIFKDDRDRERLLVRLGEACEEYDVRLYLFCFMGNHVHFLLETPQGNLSAFMHKLQTAYTVYFNLRHHRAGHLMQGRFGAVIVQGDAYLLSLSRYIHLNPVFTVRSKRLPMEERLAVLRSYRWSSYMGYVGLMESYGCIAEGPVLGMFGKREKKQRREYGRFVEAGLAETDAAFLEILKGAKWAIGDETFQDQIRDQHTDLCNGVKRPEDVAFRKDRALILPRAVLDAVAVEFELKVSDLKRRQYGDVSRGVASLMLGRHAGMNQRDIASTLKLGTGSAVSRQLQRLRDQLTHDDSLRKSIDRIGQTINPGSSNR